MTTVAEAFVTLRPDLSKFGKETTSGVGKVLGGLKNVLGPVVAIGAAAAAASAVFIKAAADEEQGMIRLRRAVELVSGTAMPGIIDSFEKQISVMERTTAFSDGEMRDSLSLLVALTGDAKEGFNRLSFAQDLAVGADLDLASASRLLGKLTDENVGVLKRYGIAVKAGAKEEDVLAAVHAKFGGQAVAFGKTAAGQWAIFGHQVDNLKEEIGFALLPTFMRFIQAATSGVDSLRKKWTELQPTIKAAQGWLKGIWDSAPVQFFVNTVFNELKKIPGFVANVAGSIGEMFSVLTGSKPEAGGELRKLVGDDNAVGIMKTIGSVRETFKTAFDLMKPIVQGVIDKVIELRQKFDDLPPVLQKFAAGLVVGQVTGFNTAVAGLALSSVSAASGILSIGKSIAGAGGLGAVLKGGVTALGGFAEALAGPAIVVTAIVLAIWAVVEVVKTVSLVIENWDKVLIILDRALAGPKQALADLWHGIQDFMAPLGQLVSLFATDFPRALGLTFGAITRLVVDGWNAYVAFIGNVWTAIFELPGKIAKIFGDIVDGVVTAIGEWWTTAGPAIGGFLETVLTGFFPLIDKLEKLAGDAIGGFVKGIFDAIPGAIKSVLDFAGKVLKGFREGFDAKSPSRKMMGIGGDLMTGLKQGIDAGIKLPQLALDGMDLSIPSLSAGGSAKGPAGGGLAGSTINLNIGPMTLNYTGSADPTTVKQMGSDTLDFITRNLSDQLSRLGTG